MVEAEADIVGGSIEESDLGSGASGAGNVNQSAASVAQITIADISTQVLRAPKSRC